ncbi:MAG TPA: GNAT family N-acetyltransferase [Streptosporangiaceae bacterium]|nr:GNAT family N-acetyltransferase [Streptosporangiaceae bacterium]
MSERYFLRPITPGEFDAFCGVPIEAFNDADRSAEAIEQERVVFEFDRSLAAFDGDAIVGTTAAYSFQLTVPGGVVSAGGVTFVSVLPSHRRRGILSAMMRHQLADIAARGEPVAALFASESVIYGRYGYGCASGQLSLTIRRGEGALNPATAAKAATGHGSVRLRAGQPAGVRTELAKVYDAAVPHRPGMMARDERWWHSVLADPESSRRGMSPLKCLLAGDESGPRGYALYRTKPDWDENGLPCGSLSVRELIAADGAAAAALWADLLTRDLIGEVVARQRPVDDPLLDMLADRRRARAYLTDGLWVRLTDIPAALCRRRYRCAADVVLEVIDDLLPANAGRWRLQCPGPADGAAASCERTTAAADIVLPVAALGAGYLGGARLGTLAAAGLVTEHTPGTLAMLSAAMHSDPAPWCPSMF